MRAEVIEARNFLADLRPGDPVRIKVDDDYAHVTVQRPLRSADPGGFGSTESSRVTVGYGPGRWNREVTVEALAADKELLTRREA
jgi:hypothetical protein